MTRLRQNDPFWKRHSLSLTASAVTILWFTLYLNADPKSHTGSFFGNALADWTGVVVTVIATKWSFEKGSKESRQPKRRYSGRVFEFLHEHSLTVFLMVTGIGWVILFSRVSPESKWGTVVSNIVSEWSQQIGLVVLTKKLIERGSKESHRWKSSGPFSLCHANSRIGLLRPLILCSHSPGRLPPTRWLD